MGWGLAVLLHALRVFVFSGESGVTEQMIEKEMEREASRKQWSWGDKFDNNRIYSAVKGEIKMNIAIIYDSSTGTTAKAAETMGKTMEAQGHQCRVQSVAEADPADVSEADLICVGSWVKGLFIILQHPTEGTMQYIERLGNLSGKNVIVFCTYKLAIGSTLRQMTKALEGKGANVVGQFKYRGPEPNNKFASFAASLT